MSAGTRVYTVRLPLDLVTACELQVVSRNSWSPREPWSLSDFIRIALDEKLRKMKRSREQGGGRSKRRGATPAG